MSKAKLTDRLRRMQLFLCPKKRKPHEVKTCGCVKGAFDVGDGEGAQTGCKELHEAWKRIEAQDKDE